MKTKLIFYSVKYDHLIELGIYPGYELIGLIVRHEFGMNLEFMYMGEL